MKEPNFFKERIYPILFMVVITVVFISVVSGIYLATEERVKLNEALFLRSAVLYAADISVPEDAEKVQEVYQKRVEEVINEETGDPTYFRILDESGNLSGYAVYAQGPGLWGQIVAIVGFEADLTTLTGVEFIKQNETPGLGARITENWFKEQFRGKEGPFTLVPEESETEQNEINAITGATRTSTSVRSIMNEVVEAVDKKVEG
jgi:Na+-transporting NADH:ubiquinone oxidoreductase subunit C